ncbi:WPP domain-interacting tail-anchored protein 1 isoform X2 [Nicotiana sylvestris]|nr:PREDICTED: WPP domain-interacting tail-anchored protein 1 isoform X2 [Nicotiana sylvestris]XP_009798664.1 PREDICTED: WPP domain-interacting tail-anchored protein 1 isoform X2 [Nicotiana sylvestris]
MDADTENNGSASIEGVNVNEVEVESNTVDSLEVLSSSGDVMQEVESGEMLTRLELELACFSEKLVNLDILVMHVATRESDFEAFSSEKEHTSNDIVEKAIEFDLLSGVLDSEVRELGGLLSSVAMEIDNVRKIISSCGRVDETFVLIEEKLHDSEKSLKQSQDHLLELRAQCTNFHGIVLTSMGDQNWQGGKTVEHFNGDSLLTPKTKIKMQTVEQQRHILRMLEKSLARELDLEKKLTESRQVEEELNVRLQQETFCMEEEIEAAWQRLFEGENAAEVLLGISKELLGRLQIAHFNLNGTVQRESNLQSKLQEVEENLKTKDNLLRKSEITCKEHGDKVKFLEQRLEDSEFQLSNYTSSAKKNLELESECKFLKEANVELDKELNLLKSSSSIKSERINLLEKQLRDSELRLQHAVASAEASQEKQIMLNATINDMENLIEDLKSKVSKAESLMDSAEEKCIILSESNSDLNEELTFARERMAFLEASLCQAEETKKATARDINFRSKLITDLIMQLALERERLEKQIALLILENKAQKKHFQQKDKVPSLSPRSDGKDTKESVLPKAELISVTSSDESKEEKIKNSSPTSVDENIAGDLLMSESKEEITDSSSGLDASRDIDARKLNFKCALTAVLVFLISAMVAVLVQHQSSQF